jgi:pyruvate kinase
MEYYGTLGPACADADMLEQMIRAGMTGIRLNLSHKSLEESSSWISDYDKAAKRTGSVPKLMIDLMGPELRIGQLTASILLKEGDKITLGKDGIPVEKEVVSAIRKGQEILLDDGKIRLTAAEDAVDGICRCKIIRGGELLSRKSIALPGVCINQPALTARDLENLENAKKYGVTDVMQPFVRGKNDLIQLRKALDHAGCSHVRIFAKIENLQGLEHLEEMIPYCDYIVIARGDLGNAVPLSKLPCVQEKIAEICKKQNAKFMVVTQMLNSMIEHPYPTRAEVNDIFQAVRQGASAVMLTGETAAGKYPLEAMKMLVETGREARYYK